MAVILTRCDHCRELAACTPVPSIVLLKPPLLCQNCLRNWFTPGPAQVKKKAPEQPAKQLTLAQQRMEHRRKHRGLAR